MFLPFTDIFNICQLKGCGESNCGSLLAAPIQGYLLGILSACLSALAGVYTEYLMKKNQDSLYWQNMQLYAYVSNFLTAFLLLWSYFDIHLMKLLHGELCFILSSARFGVLFNIVRLTVDDMRAGYSKGPWCYRLFHGYDLVTWLVVLNLAFTGLLVSWVMKYADNIVKVCLKPRHTC